MEAARRQATAELDASFFRARFDRLTPPRKRYLRAMAELGHGSHRSGEIAAVLVRSVRNVAPVRARLIGKDMIYSPAHGDTVFTVPPSDAYPKRIIPFPTSGRCASAPCGAGIRPVRELTLWSSAERPTSSTRSQEGRLRDRTDGRRPIGERHTSTLDERQGGGTVVVDFYAIGSR